MGTPAALTKIDLRVVEDEHGDLFVHVADVVAWLEGYGFQVGEQAKLQAEGPWQKMARSIHTEVLRVGVTQIDTETGSS